MRYLANQINMEMQIMRQDMRDHSYQRNFPEIMKPDFSKPIRIELPLIKITPIKNDQGLLFDLGDKFPTKPFWDK